MMLQDILGKLKWSGELKECEIIIRHRGAPNDELAISGDKVTEIKKSYFSYQGEEEEVTIPMHRILEVRKGLKTLWQKQSAK
ncbi:MAG: RNA repair domain-containing protein [Candidatus Aenigmarchaeota archaeon]